MNKHIYKTARKTLYKTTGLLNRLIPLASGKTDGFVLCYHDISDSGWEFSISYDNFIKQMEYLLKKYISISAGELENYLLRGVKPAKPFFVVTFDDGYKGIYKLKDWAVSNGIKPIAFVLSDNDKAERKQMKNDLPLLDDTEITELKKSGWDIGSHGATHIDFSRADVQSLNHEIADSKNELEKHLGIEIKCFAYPKGFYSRIIKDMVKKAGYNLAFSMDDALLSPESDRYAVPRTGIMGTHSFDEFKSTFLPLSVRTRKLLNKVGK